jgi:hypothetical protein
METQMSHLVENMAYVGETPWHGLGMPVTNDLTVAEMQKACGANFTVLKEPEFVEYNGRKIKTIILFCVSLKIQIT